MTNYSPYFKSPFTDLSGALVSHQWYGECADMEMRALDCLEAYGLDNGLKKCEPLFRDFQECARRIKQFKRITAMRLERHRQYYAGEKAKDEHWAPPPKDDSF